jgi:threonine 3-dehydrogenase
MIYMDDAIKATLDIMDAPADSIKERTSYNLAAISFSAA